MVIFFRLFKIIKLPQNKKNILKKIYRLKNLSVLINPTVINCFYIFYIKNTQFFCYLNTGFQLSKLKIKQIDGLVKVRKTIY